MTHITRNIARYLSIAVCGITLSVQSAMAIDGLPLPSGATETLATITDAATFALPIGAYSNDALPTVSLQGRKHTRVWRLDVSSLTVDQVAQPVIDDLIDNGYSMRLDCSSEACGGFDFRFAIETAKAPALFVDFRNFRFFSAQNSEQAASVLISRFADSIFIQLIHLDGSTVGTSITVTPTTTQERLPTFSLPSTDTFGAQLLSSGHIILSDLSFASGASTLQDQDFSSLENLSKFMKDNPDRKVLIVGHSDNAGTLAANIGLSRKRAQSVAQRLITKYGIEASRIQAEGAGYLSPITNNSTKDGRRQNRRVEVVLD